MEDLICDAYFLANLAVKLTQQDKSNCRYIDLEISEQALALPSNVF